MGTAGRDRTKREDLHRARGRVKAPRSATSTLRHAVVRSILLARELRREKKQAPNRGLLISSSSIAQPLTPQTMPTVKPALGCFSALQRGNSAPGWSGQRTAHWWRCRHCRKRPRARGKSGRARPRPASAPMPCPARVSANGGERLASDSLRSPKTLQVELLSS